MSPFFLLLEINIRSQEQIHWIRFKVQLAEDPVSGSNKYSLLWEEYKNWQ